MEPGDIACVILCGGEGKRMGSADRHKVCFPIAGTPAIVRTVGMLKSVGIKRFLIVVGTTAQQVIDTVTAEHPDVAFVYQRQPRGTGHAVACAVEVLKAAGHNGPVLVTMGDKIIQPHVVERLLAAHAVQRAELTLTALPKTPGTTAGRIVTDAAGRVSGVVELADIRRAAEMRRRVRVGGRRMTAGRIERSRSVNASLYMFEAPSLYDAVAALNDENAQGELYLTDTVAHVAGRGGRVGVLEVANPEDLMAYNTPEELLAVGQVFARRLSRRRRIAKVSAKLSGRSFRRAGEWLKIVQQNPPRLRRVLTAVYGADEGLLSERRKAFAGVLKRFIKTFGPRRRAVLARAPGRINLMGRHVDHRGGYVNVMAISREVILVAAPRDDDKVSLANLRPREFPDREFRVGELLKSADWFDWMDYIDSTTVRQVLEAYRGDWSNYAKAAVLRLQHACPDHRLSGFDCVVDGNIPMGAGLSSSSAVVVAVAEAAVALNGLDLTTQQFVDLCGEGEWFVGSRGGSADHAAIRGGERGKVARVGFFPFRIEETIPWPEGLSLVIANSHVRAAKSEGARDTFNQRVATYNLAEVLLPRRSAVLRSMRHLRDVDPDALGVSPGEIYRALKRLPVQVTRRSAEELLPDGHQRLEEIFATHRNIGPYRLRDVATYGIAECRRSDMFAELLRAGELKELGLLMQISHDGDRVVRFCDGRAVRHRLSYGDARLERLIADVASDNPARRAPAALWAQPGRYACSTKEIDFIVDTVTARPGVVGAQIAGAGLGGCAMILLKTEALSGTLKTLRESYYRPRRLKFDVHVCQPVGGSGILSA